MHPLTAIMRLFTPKFDFNRTGHVTVSKYKPHQGKQEKARRVKQYNAGYYYCNKLHRNASL